MAAWLSRVPPLDVDAEAERLQRRCEFAAEWQVTAAGFWTNLQFFLGATAAALAAVSSGSAFSDHSVLAGSLAAAAALAAAVLASLRPAERAEAHQQAAAAFHALAVDARLFRQLDPPPEQQAREALTTLERRTVELNTTSPWAPRRLARKTEKFLRNNQRYYDNEGPPVDPKRPAPSEARTDLQPSPER